MDDEMEEIRKEFLAEADEMLESLNQRFVSLEADPSNTELLNQIFRDIHSIKGSAGFLGFARLVEVTHRGESILNRLRQGDLTVDKVVTDAILESVDVIKLIMSDIRKSGTDQHVATEAITRKLDEVLAGTTQPSPPRSEIGGSSAPVLEPVSEPQPLPPPIDLGEFLVAEKIVSREQLNKALKKQSQPARLKKGQKSQPPPPDLGKILVGEGMVSKAKLAEALKRHSEATRPQDPQLPDPPPSKLGDILIAEGLVSRDELLEAMEKQAGRPVERDEPPQTTVGEESSSEPASEIQPKVTRSDEEQTIRVETRRLDNVMNMVGELVLGRNRLLKIGAMLEQTYEHEPRVRELSETLSQLNLVTTDLQHAVMMTRLLPIRKVFAKIPRLVRDLSQKLDKQVKLELYGEETELDKSVVDEISDPLLHLIRNAVDHGIEPAAERRAAGKPADGTIRLTASQEGNCIFIRVQDDGRGLQVEKIKAKALARGLVNEAEVAAMDPYEVINLIFLPGFSTAEQVTDISGRGVGMDVVRSNIRRLNGTVELQSAPGTGSLVSIKLPLTIAIIQALLVEVERSTFAIPLAVVVEAVRITPTDIKTVNGREVLNLRERVLPLLRLSDEFEIPVDASLETFFVVVVSLGERTVGVIVDGLRSQEEIVIKPLWEYLDAIKGITGATITGEGKVVLILDIGELAENVRALGSVEAPA